MTPRSAPFRAGGQTPPNAPRVLISETAGALTYLADISEFQPWMSDAVYLEWSKAIVIRALYGSSHEDKAWYGGMRRTLLHQGGVRFLGIYQYLVAGQSSASQAAAFKSLVGAIEPGEVFIADAEEGNHALLIGWYNAMLTECGDWIHKYLWTYTGENFGAANDLLPVEWIAAYGQSEPSSPHKLWQFTDSYEVPGVGRADCSLYHGTIDELASLAYSVPITPSTFGPPQNLAVRSGTSTVLVERCDPPLVVPAPIDHYEISVYVGSYPSVATLCPSYPRYMADAPAQFGNLHVPAGEHMTCRTVAYTAAGEASEYADVHFQMGM